MKVVFTGGGTMGSVSPLLAEIDYLLSHKGFLPSDFIWIGTKNGPERKIIELYGIKFYSISAGKWRRYFSWKNFIDPFLIILGFIQSIKLISQFDADLVVSAGSFVSVPAIYAARFNNIKILIHQLDYRPGLANRLMAKVADEITVSWPELIDKFNAPKVAWVGTPVRKSIVMPNKAALDSQLDIQSNKPLMLVMGGGTGAVQLNKLTISALPQLLKRFSIIHLTGNGKSLVYDKSMANINDYVQREFLTDDLGYVMHKADFIVCRSGLGTISEILAIRKPALIIPLNDWQQTENAKYFSEKKLVKSLDPANLTIKKYINGIEDFYNSIEKQQKFLRSIDKYFKINGSELLAKEIIDLIKS